MSKSIAHKGSSCCTALPCALHRSISVTKVMTISATSSTPAEFTAAGFDDCRDWHDWLLGIDSWGCKRSFKLVRQVKTCRAVMCVATAAAREQNIRPKDIYTPFKCYICCCKSAQVSLDCRLCMYFRFSWSSKCEVCQRVRSNDTCADQHSQLLE